MLLPRGRPSSNHACHVPMSRLGSPPTGTEKVCAWTSRDLLFERLLDLPFKLLEVAFQLVDLAVDLE